MKHAMLFSAIAACTALALSGCGREESASDIEPPASAEVLADMEAVSQASNQFAFDLYAKLAEKEGNIAFSPYSISTALAMTYAGARGDTAKEMAQALHLPFDGDRLHLAFGGLIRHVQSGENKQEYELAVANRLWPCKDRLSLVPEFSQLMRTRYRAEAQLLDFVGDPDGSRRTINDWVEDKTKKKIVDLLPPRSIDANTRLVLTNAIYFKAQWAFPFPEGATRPGEFTIPDKPAVRLPLMHRTFEAEYLETPKFQLAEFKYRGDQYSMVIIVPRLEFRLADVARSLSSDTLNQLLSKTHRKWLDITLPKFKAKKSLDLSEDLQALGIKAAFKTSADFSGISASTALHISAVHHQASVALDEMGTEAAAGTAVRMAISEAASPIAFHVTRPFEFALRHRTTNSILFLGNVYDPTRE